MDLVREVRARARRDVADLDGVHVHALRHLRDLELAALMRRAPRFVRRVMRRHGLLRPWWERSPLLIVVGPLMVTVAVMFANPLAFVVGVALVMTGFVTEPRMGRAERREERELTRAYRHAAADALDARADAKIEADQWDLRHLWDRPEGWDRQG